MFPTQTHRYMHGHKLTVKKKNENNKSKKKINKLTRKSIEMAHAIGNSRNGRCLACKCANERPIKQKVIFVV